MKSLGIVGGIGPESTIDYYRLLLARFRERSGEAANLPLFINSIDLESLRALVEAGRLTDMAEVLISAVERLARAGVDLGFLAANTAHIVFDEVQRRSPIPLVSIVEATCEEAHARGLKRVGLLGTRFTMQGRFFPDVFLRRGISVVIPEPAEQEYVHDRYFAEWVPGIFLPETRAEVLAIIDRLCRREGIEAVILGGTELPLLLRDAGESPVPLLDTTHIHVEAILDRAGVARGATGPAR
jgi:aspartate racemase